MTVYYGNWSSKEDMARDFDGGYSGQLLHEAMAADVIFAAYATESYEGDAIVLFRKDGKLFEVHGSHCSCYGLEGQWKPEEVEPDVLLGRLERSGGYGAMGSFGTEIKAALAPDPA